MGKIGAAVAVMVMPRAVGVWATQGSGQRDSGKQGVAGRHARQRGGHARLVVGETSATMLMKERPNRIVEE